MPDVVVVALNYVGGSNGSPWEGLQTTCESTVSTVKQEAL